MVVLTEESLNKLSKSDLVAAVVSLQSKKDSGNSDLVAEPRKTREGFDQRKSDLSLNRKNPKYRKTMLGKCPILQDFFEISSIRSSTSGNDFEDIFAKQ